MTRDRRRRPSRSASPGVRREQRAARRWYVFRLSPLAIFLAVFFLTPFVILFLYSFGRSSIVSLSFGTNLDNWSTVLTDEFYRRLLVRSIVTGVDRRRGRASCSPSRSPTRSASGRCAGTPSCSSSPCSSACSRRTSCASTLGARCSGATGSSTRRSASSASVPTTSCSSTGSAVVVTLVNVLVPMAILPIYSSLAQVDPALTEAARDAGAGSLRTLGSVTIPLASRGINAGFALCFLIAAGDYVTPQFVGGHRRADARQRDRRAVRHRLQLAARLGARLHARRARWRW